MTISRRKQNDFQWEERLMIFTRLVLLAAGTAVALATIGCGKQNNHKPVFQVSGRVTFRGEPMTGAVIGFHPLNVSDLRAVHATSKADKDGHFSLTTYATGDGAPAGEYAVTIYWPGKRLKKVEPNEDEDEELPPDRLSRAYSDPKSAKLRGTVREQPNTIDFNLP
jgi:hypothetical protein